MLLGRGQVRCPIKTGHFFGATYANLEGIPIVNEPGLLRGWMSSPIENPRVYTIKSAGYDLMRVESEAEPLRQSELQNTPAGAVLSLKTQLKMWIQLYDFVDSRPIIIDWGQEVEVLAEKVTIGIVAPDNFYAVPPDNFRPPESVPVRSGRLVDAVIGAVVWAMEAPRGITTATLTTNHLIEIGAQPAIPVPTNAVGVTGYQSPIGAASTQWTMMYGDIVVGTPAGTLPWAARKTLDEEIPLPNIGFLLPDVDPITARFFTLRWTIQL
jgi:hypothetical protein